MLSSLFALVLGGCSVSLGNAPSTSPNGYQYGYGRAPIQGAPLYTSGGTFGKPVPARGTTIAKGDGQQGGKPAVTPSPAPQRDKPTTKPAPHRTKPTPAPHRTKPQPTVVQFVPPVEKPTSVQFVPPAKKPTTVHFVPPKPNTSKPSRPKPTPIPRKPSTATKTPQRVAMHRVPVRKPVPTR